MVEWVARKVGARVAAALWWLVMLLYDVAVVLLWVGVIQRPSVGSAVVAALVTIVVGIPIVHEWPNARRMTRLLVHGA